MRELRNNLQQQIFYYALAPKFEWIREWCWRHNLDVRNVRYVFDKRDIAGASDYGLILFDRIYDKYEPALIELIRSRSSLIKSSYDTPVVLNGRIVGWK